MSGQKSTTPPSPIDLALYVHPERPGRYVWAIDVRSINRPGLMQRGSVDHEPEKDQGQQIGVVAGAMAEMLCEKYNDPIEPSDIAKLATDYYYQVMHALVEGNRNGTSSCPS